MFGPNMGSKKLAYILAVGCILLTCGKTSEVKEGGVHYTAADGIEVLDAETFRKTVYNSPISWFVKFYSQWCGHCKLFAPTYRSLAKDIKDWQHVVRLASVDCVSKSASGLDTGRQVCFKKPFFISGMPDFRFFPANTTDTEFAGERREYEGRKVYASDGKVLEDSDSLEKVRDKIIDFIQENPGNAAFSLDTIKKKDLETVINNAEKFDGQEVVIIEPKSSYTGRQVILDMTAFTGIRVHRAAETNKKVLALLKDSLGFTFRKSPTVLIVKSGSSFTEIQIPEEEKDHRKYIRSKLQVLPGVKRIPEEEMEGADEQIDESVDLENPSELLDIDRSKVYMNDLEVALHYSLRKEVSGVEYIQGRYLQALKDYLALLVKYFPGRKSVMKYLWKINNQVKHVLASRMIVWGTWQEILEEADEASGGFLTDKETYYGCSGSRPDLRGFPCSLWQLFHMVVSEAYKEEPDGEWAIGVLISMQEYIARFFTCMECRHHWAVATKDIDEVSNSTDAVLFLWSKHNEVNLRLSGGKNDDPAFPKVQWPTKELCPKCWMDDVEFDKDEVLKFLLKFYSPENILMEHLESFGRKVEHEEL